MAEHSIRGERTLSHNPPQSVGESVPPGSLHRHWVWLAASALLLAAQISPWCYPIPDAYQYLSMAKNLAHGHGLTAVRDANERPAQAAGLPAAHQPLVPHLRSPVPAALDPPFHPGGRVLGGAYLWARRVAPDAAVWIAALTAVNGALWVAYRQPLSDVAFACGCIWSVNLLYAALDARGAGALLATALAAAAMLIATCAVRYLGITFALGCCLALVVGAWRRQIRWPRALALTLLLGLVSAATVAALIAREHAMAAQSGTQTYVGLLKASASGLSVTYPRGLQWLIAGIGRDMIPGMLKTYGPAGKWLNINMALHIPLFALLLLGWTRWVRRPADPFAWALPVYVAVLVAYSGEYGVRYCVPLLPAPLGVPMVWLGRSARPARWHPRNSLGAARRRRPGLLVVDRSARGSRTGPSVAAGRSPRGPGGKRSRARRGRSRACGDQSTSERIRAVGTIGARPADRRRLRRSGGPRRHPVAHRARETTAAARVRVELSARPLPVAPTRRDAVRAVAEVLHGSIDA